MALAANTSFCLSLPRSSPRKSSSSVAGLEASACPCPESRAAQHPRGTQESPGRDPPTSPAPALARAAEQGLRPAPLAASAGTATAISFFSAQIQSDNCKDQIALGELQFQHTSRRNYSTFISFIPATDRPAAPLSTASSLH